MMEWFDGFESSTIRRIGYDHSLAILGVEFKVSGIYHYYDVPLQVYEEMKNAESKGQYLARRIKGSYRYAKI